MKAFIFDVGGVFRDSSEAISFSMKRGFESLGYILSFGTKDIWHLMGFEEFNDFPNLAEALLLIMKSGVNIKNVLEMDDPVSFVISLKEKIDVSEEVKKMTPIIKETFYRSKNLMKVIRPSVDGVRIIKEKGYKMGVVTVTEAKFTEKWLKENIGDFFEAIVGNAYPEKYKGIVKVCSHLGFETGECAFVGDTQIDVRSAKKADCVSIAVLCGMGTRKMLEREKPDYIFSDVLDMAKHIL